MGVICNWKQYKQGKIASDAVTGNTRVSNSGNFCKNWERNTNQIAEITEQEFKEKPW